MLRFPHLIILQVRRNWRTRGNSPTTWITVAPRLTGYTGYYTCIHHCSLGLNQRYNICTHFSKILLDHRKVHVYQLHSVLVLHLHACLPWPAAGILLYHLEEVSGWLDFSALHLWQVYSVFHMVLPLLSAGVSVPVILSFCPLLLLFYMVMFESPSKNHWNEARCITWTGHELRCKTWTGNENLAGLYSLTISLRKSSVHKCNFHVGKLCMQMKNIFDK